MAANVDPMEENENKAPESSVGSIPTASVVSKSVEATAAEAGKEMTRCDCDQYTCNWNDSNQHFLPPSITNQTRLRLQNSTDNSVVQTWALAHYDIRVGV